MNETHTCTTTTAFSVDGTEDGYYFARERYEGTDADLRTVVVPEFYREVAGFRCAYR